MKKYIYQNGLMLLNPNYNLPIPLTIFSTPDEIMMENQERYAITGKPLQLSEKTIASIEIMQNKEFLDLFGASVSLDGGIIIDGIASVFKKFNTPIGLLNNLLSLVNQRLNFIIDDSGSMMMQHEKGSTRWMHLEKRLHDLIDFLAYIPTATITIMFLNRNDSIVLQHQGKTPQEFAQMAHSLIKTKFMQQPQGPTPILRRLRDSLNLSNQARHYLFTDGEPSDCSISQIKVVLLHRSQPSRNPIKFINLGDEEVTEWMEQVEDEVVNLQVHEEFKEDCKKFAEKHGPVFPYTEGYWLVSQLAIDGEHEDLKPFSKQDMENLMGYKLTDEAYARYVNHHPKSTLYGSNSFSVSTKPTFDKKSLLQYLDGAMTEKELDSVNLAIQETINEYREHVRKLICELGVNFEQLKNLGLSMNKLIGPSFEKTLKIHAYIPIAKFLALSSDMQNEISNNIVSIDVLVQKEKIPFNLLLSLHKDIRSALYRHPYALLQAVDGLCIAALENPTFADALAVLLNATFNLNQKDQDNNSLLQHVLLGKYFNFARYLIEVGVELNNVNNSDQSALEIAAMQGKTNIVLLLIQKNAEVRIHAFPESRAAYLAEQNNYLETAQSIRNLRSLVVDFGVSLEQIRGLELSKLICLTGFEFTKVQLIHWFLPLPRFLALEKHLQDEMWKNINAIQILQEKFAVTFDSLMMFTDPAIRNIFYRAPLDIMFACSFIYDRMSQMHDQASTEYLTLKSAWETFFNPYLKSTQKDEGGNSPLQSALLNGRWGLARFLIDSGMELNNINKQDLSALEIAAMKGKTKLALLLIEKGAEIRKNTFPASSKASSLAWKAGFRDTAETLRQVVFEKELIEHDKQQEAIYQRWEELETLRYATGFKK